MSRTTVAISMALLVCFCVSSASAQSLGDVAKKEGERRQGVKPSGNFITNKDLPTVPTPSSAPPVTPAAGKVAGDGAAADTDKAKADKDSQDDQGKDAKAGPKDEAAWANRMKQAREGLQRDQMFAESLQSRINALTVDFVNRDDPSQRDQIAVERQKAIDELDRVKKSVIDRTQAIADIEEEARRAGVPAGWLR
jgi:hypothetical protein